LSHGFEIRLMADDAGHLYLTSRGSIERFTGAHSDYVCRAFASAVSPSGDRGFGEIGRSATFSDTGCEDGATTPLEGLVAYQALHVMRSGALIGTAHALQPAPGRSSDGVVVRIDASGALTTAPLDSPASSAFECGTHVCMLGLGSLLVLDPETLTFGAPVPILAPTGVRDFSVNGLERIASLGNGEALYAFPADDTDNGDTVLHVVRLRGLPH
jgi:hypothetical protein